MTRDEIQKEFDRFFEFDTADRSVVTSVSARLFAEHIAAIAASSEREESAKVCEEIKGVKLQGHEFAAAIRALENYRP